VEVDCAPLVADEVPNAPATTSEPLSFVDRKSHDVSVIDAHTASGIGPASSGLEVSDSDVREPGRDAGAVEYLLLVRYLGVSRYTMKPVLAHAHRVCRDDNEASDGTLPDRAL